MEIGLRFVVTSMLLLDGNKEKLFRIRMQHMLSGFIPVHVQPQTRPNVYRHVRGYDQPPTRCQHWLDASLDI